MNILVVSCSSKPINSDKSLNDKDNKVKAKVTTNLEIFNKKLEILFPIATHQWEKNPLSNCLTRGSVLVEVSS